MSMRKLNFSGRKKIASSDISIEITKGEVYEVTKLELDNTGYMFPASAKIQLVVKQGQRAPSYHLGTIDSIDVTNIDLSKNFTVEDRLRFTLKIADEKGHWLGWSANWFYPEKEAKSGTSEISLIHYQADELVKNYDVDTPDEEAAFDGSNPVVVKVNKDLYNRMKTEPEMRLLIERGVLESVFWQAKPVDTPEEFDLSTWEGNFLHWFCEDDGCELLDSPNDIQQRLDSKVHEIYRGDVVW